MKTLKTFIPAILLMSVALLWHACTKRDYSQQSDFFKSPSDLAFFKAANGELAKVDFLNKTVDRFKILDAQHHFANTLKSKYGNAKWNMTLVVRNTDSLYTLITPFIDERDSVTALLFAYHSAKSTTTYKVYNKENYKQYFTTDGSSKASNINRSTVEGLFGSFSKSNAYLKRLENGGTLPRVLYVTWICWYYTWTYGSNGVGVSNTQCSYSIFDSGGNGGNNNPGGTGSEPGTEIKTPGDPDGAPNGPTETWTYQEVPSPNQDIIDSLQGYPCAQEILGRMPNLNEFTDALLNKIFDVSPSVNVIFKADSDGLLGDDNGGTAERYTQNGKLYIKVLLNPSMMENASQEFTLAVMLHESIHAYYKFEMAKYEAGIVDSFYIKSNFPKLWQYRNETGGASGEHREMSEGIMNNIADALKVFNSYLDPSVRRALALNGLHKTPYWRSLSDTNNIKLTWDVARYGDSTAAATVNLHKCRY